MLGPALVSLAVAVATALVVLPGAGTSLVISIPVPDPDAIVTLASHEWERLPMAARLATRYPNAALLLTEPREVNLYNCHDCARRVGRLVRAGVAEPRIHVLPIPTSGTHGEALAALAFARREGVRRLAIVTSPYHTRRALATFRTVFAGTGTAIGIEPASDSSPAQPTSWWRAPYDRWYVRYEWAAIAYYWLRYGVNALAPNENRPISSTMRGAALPSHSGGGSTGARPFRVSRQPSTILAGSVPTTRLVP